MLLRQFQATESPNKKLSKTFAFSNEKELQPSTGVKNTSFQDKLRLVSVLYKTNIIIKAMFFVV